MSDNSPPSPIATVRSCPYDLVARAHLALEACVAFLDPALGGQPYSYIELHTDPPVAMHAPWDYGDSSGHLLDALTLARAMTGTQPDERDALLAAHLLSHQREDGLMVVPAAPWTLASPSVEMEWTQRGALMAWTTRYLAFDDIEALNAARKMVQGLARYAVWDRDSCWFPASVLPAAGWQDRTPPMDRSGDILIGGQIVFPLVRFAEATGDEQAKKLASGLIRFLRNRSGAFDTAGHITNKAARYLHSNAGFLKGALRHAILAGDEEEILWARSTYATLRAYGLEFGFFPHRDSAGADRWQGDTAFLKDMIEIGLMLGNYADRTLFRDVERFGRNHLLESQLLDLDWVTNETETEFPQQVWCANHPPEGLSAEEVTARAVGGFASWSRVNDAFDPANPRLMLRSTAAATRAIYDLWHHSVMREDEAVCVNLLFSRDTRWATVNSHAPREGHVEILMKTRGVLAVRIPDEANNDEVEVLVNYHRQRAEELRQGYAWIEALRNGDLVTIKWPLREREETYHFNGQEYRAKWRSDTMLSIDPPGKLTPLYRRSADCASAPAHGGGKGVKEIYPF